jgi:hypothetical protein
MYTTHSFEGVAAEVWEYQIGGYQVQHKYLKDRKGGKMDNPAIISTLRPP